MFCVLLRSSESTVIGFLPARVFSNVADVCKKIMTLPLLCNGGGVVCVCWGIKANAKQKKCKTIQPQLYIIMLFLAPGVFSLVFTNEFEQKNKMHIIHANFNTLQK